MSCVVVATLAVAVTMPGCDGDSPGEIRLDQIKEQSMTALCEYLVRCGQFPDPAACRAAFFAELQAYPDVASGITVYDGAAAAECLDAFRSFSCGAADSRRSADPVECRGVFTGTRINGSDCLSDFQCQSQTCNLARCGGETCCAGSCEARVDAGRDCSATLARCVQGTYCNFGTTISSRTCTPLAAAGQPCEGTYECALELICAADPVTRMPICRRPSGRGQACESTSCDLMGDICDSTSRTCVPRAGVGAACVGDTCVPYARCDIPTRKCVALAKVGGPCTTDVDCASRLCAGTVCVAQPDRPACP